MASPNRRDHLVEMVESLEDSLQDMGPLLGFPQIEARASHHHGLSMVDEVGEHLLQVEDLRLVVDDGQQDDAEGGLHLRHLVELVENDLWHLAPLHLENDADSVPARFVPQVADSFEALVPHQTGDVLQQLRLVDLVGNLADDDRLPVGSGVGFDRCPRPHLNAASSRVVGIVDSIQTMDETAGREVGAGDDLHQFLDGHLGTVDQQDEAVDDLSKVVRRNIGCHPDRDSGRPVDQEIRESGRQHHRLFQRAIIVLDPVDSFLVDILLQ